jgi:oxygen-independent coproporphyrinogen-3 oxidase
MSTDARAESPGCGVYVHVPFCRRRCVYCDFAFEVRKADPRYADAVLLEVDARRGELPGPPASLSFGGGTPSALPVDDLARLVDGIRARTGLLPDAEVSLELNPEDVDEALPRALRDAGFGRASLGVQSFDDDVLRYLGRDHDGAQARAAVEACVRAGLSTGVDLIVGVPGEGDARLADDVSRIADLGAQHVSAYVLTLEAGTPLVQLIDRGKRARLDDDAQADAYERVQELLPARGFMQYEVSNHAVPGHESRHNRIYWQGGMYLGVGPNAHSMRRFDDGRVRRRITLARFDAWVKGPAEAEHEVDELAPRHAFLEAVAFGLRDMAAGVDVSATASRHQIVDDALVRRVTEAIRACGDDVREGRDGRLRLTSRGARFADNVARAVLAADDDRG